MRVHRPAASLGNTRTIDDHLQMMSEDPSSNMVPRATTAGMPGATPPPGTAEPAATQPHVFQRLDQTARYPYTPTEYAARFAWRFVEATLIRFSLPRSYGWRRFWLRRFGAKLADTARTRPTTHVFHPWLLTMGEHASLADRVDVYNLGPVTVGDHSVVSQGAELCAGTHDYTQPDLPLKRSPVTVGRGVWICAEAFIGPGVVVGDNAVVGARAVAIGNVQAGMVVAGNPAVVVKPRTMQDGPPASRPPA